MHVLVLAKAPVAGRVKTRLCPPCTGAEAAELAQASLLDTLHVALATGAQVVLALDGEAGAWLPEGVQVVPQGSGSLSERLAAAWRHMSGPAVQVGMDTPQLTPSDLIQAYESLQHDDVDAVLGPAEDGGWWLIGLPRGMPEVFLGLPTSTPDAGERQHERLVQLGLRVALLETRNDVDTIEDARSVAAAAPHTRFARAFSRLGSQASLPARR